MAACDVTESPRTSGSRGKTQENKTKGLQTDIRRSKFSGHRWGAGGDLDVSVAMGSTLTERARGGRGGNDRRAILRADEPTVGTAGAVGRSQDLADDPPDIVILTRPDSKFGAMKGGRRDGADNTHIPLIMSAGLVIE
jgi:hypothetical protein